MEQKELTKIQQGRGEIILLVEDEEMLLELLHVLLEENGYRVLLARDGIEAVALFERHHDEIKLVLSDMGLPKLGGWEAFQRMRKINPAIKGILASGYFDPELRQQMLDIGAEDFVQKPYIPSKILNQIRQILDDAALK
ncbi:MAG: response regulator [bacterium]